MKIPKNFFAFLKFLFDNLCDLCYDKINLGKLTKPLR